MFSKLVYLLPAFLSVVTGARLPYSADITGVPSSRGLDVRAVEPTLDFSESTWIWTGEQNGAANDLAPVGVRPFRKAIPSSSTKCPVCATIIISSDDLYSIVVNGREIGVGNGYLTSAVYTVGLEPEGHNVFAIAVNNTGGAGGLIPAIRVDYSDGTTQTIVTDTTWKTIKATPPGGWTSPNFNDSAWISASSEGPTGKTPWGMPPLPPAMSMAGVSWIRTNETSAAGVDPLGHRPFRKTISSPYGKAAVCGKVVITADDEYTLYVNGKNIGNGSNWEAMQAYSIPILDADENLIAVDSVNTKPVIAGLIAGVLVAYSDGTSETYYTDDSWKTLAAPSPADFQATDLDDSSWTSATKFMRGGTPTIPSA
ncbi:lectin [Armillaria novae-zelandiae]|uniref:Lectin n=1 Tax=Armillaria novae-zelandiae TaxID=153914 RepID=A0AA39UG15_9AGAR|nr:lectin [Armillaria novae-zelandiae]